MLLCTFLNCQKWVCVCPEAASAGLGGWELCLIVEFTVGEAHRPNWHGQWWSICSFQWEPIWQGHSLMTAHVVSICGRRKGPYAHCPSTNEAKSPGLYLGLLEDFSQNLEPEHHLSQRAYRHMYTHTQTYTQAIRGNSDTHRHTGTQKHTATWLRDGKNITAPLSSPSPLSHTYTCRLTGENGVEMDRDKDREWVKKKVREYSEREKLRGTSVNSASSWAAKWTWSVISMQRSSPDI